MWLRSNVPVLAIADDTLQVGIARPLVFSGLSAREHAFLCALEQRHQHVTAAERRQHPLIIERLKRHGLLTSEDRQVPVDAGVRIHGLGLIGLQIATGLARSGVHALNLIDSSPANAEPQGTFALGAAHGSCAQAAAWTLRASALPVHLLPHHVPAQLEVVIAHGAAPLTVTTALTAADTPYLLVCTDERGVSVGPLVRPGATACARCVNLARADRDPHWLRAVSQLERSRRPHAEPPTAALAAAVATREAVDFLSGMEIPSRRWRVTDAAGTRETRTDETRAGETGAGAAGASETGVQDARLDQIGVENVPAHPDCGCGAAGPVGDDVAARRARMSTTSP